MVGWPIIGSTSGARKFERASVLAYNFLSFLFVLCLLLISLKLPPLIVKSWVRLGIHALLALMGVRILFELFLHISRPEAEHRKFRGAVVSELTRFVLVVLMLVLVLGHPPFWLVAWWWNVLQFVTMLLAASAFVRLVALLVVARFEPVEKKRSDAGHRIL